LYIVKAPFAPLHRLLEFRHVAQVSLHPFELDLAQSPRVTPGPQQRLNLVFAREQLVHKVRTDETRSPGNETVHELSLGNFTRAEKQKSDAGLALTVIRLLKPLEIAAGT
jgi:hypothetical protein